MKNYHDFYARCKSVKIWRLISRLNTLFTLYQHQSAVTYTVYIIKNLKNIENSLIFLAYTRIFYT